MITPIQHSVEKQFCYSGIPLFVLISVLIHIGLLAAIVSHFQQHSENRSVTQQAITLSFVKTREPHPTKITDIHTRPLNSAEPARSPANVTNTSKAENPVNGVEHPAVLALLSSHAPDAGNLQPASRSRESRKTTTENIKIENTAEELNSTEKTNTPVQQLTVKQNNSQLDPASASTAIQQNRSRFANNNEDQALKQRVLHRVNDELRKHIHYPLLARKRGWSGIVTIGFQFSDNGLIRNIHLTKSSGYPALDQSALNAFNQITNIYFDNPLHIDHLRVLQLPVEYRLIEG